MKATKTATSREFQHRFGDLAQALKPGESITVTKRGKPLGFFTKAPKPRKAPDYLANLQKLGHSMQTGQKLIEEICGVS
jgi:antitoxin (DNA-binding transcriptional repressor) of toxin-antitoxin stability system